MPMHPHNIRGFHGIKAAAYIFGLFKKWIIGQPLSTHPKTNATFFVRGTRTRSELEPPGWWSYIPGYQRAIYRHLGTSIIGWGIYEYFVYRDDLWWTLITLFWTAVIYGTFICIVKSKRRTHYNEFVKPIADSIRDLFDIGRRVPPRDFIIVPTGHQDNPDRAVVVKLPKTFAQPETVRNKNADFVVEKLKMLDPIYHYELSGAEPKLVIRSAPYPPDRVGYEEIAKHYEAALAEDVWVLGLGKGYLPVTVSLHRDSPHILLSMASGGGKSEFCKGFILQAVRRGFRVVVLDGVKRGESVMWARDIEQVEVVTTIEKQHNFLVQQSRIVIDRQEKNVASRGESKKHDIPTLIVFEEANTAMDMLKEYWKNEAPNATNPDKIGNRSGTSPAISAIRHILSAGRSAQTHLLTVAQRASADVCGGGNARENYAIRVANRYQQQTVKMLFPDVDPTPESPGLPGRVQVVINGKAQLTQTPFFGRQGNEFYTNPLALEWALNTARPRTEPQETDEITLTDSGWTPPLTSENKGGQGSERDDKVGQIRERETIEALDPWITLNQALQQNVVQAPSLAALQKRAQRDPNFPKPVEKDNRNINYYDRDALIQWQANRDGGSKP